MSKRFKIILKYGNYNNYLIRSDKFGEVYKNYPAFTGVIEKYSNVMCPGFRYFDHKYDFKFFGLKFPLSENFDGIEFKEDRFMYKLYLDHFVKNINITDEVYKNINMYRSSTEIKIVNVYASTLRNIFDIYNDSDHESKIDYIYDICKYHELGFNYFQEYCDARVNFHDLLLEMADILHNNAPNYILRNGKIGFLNVDLEVRYASLFDRINETYFNLKKKNDALRNFYWEQSETNYRHLMM